MAGLSKLKETSLKVLIIKFAKLIATNKLSKVPHHQIYVQVISCKGPVLTISDDEVEIEALFDEDCEIPSHLQRGDILKLSDWRLQADYNHRTKEIRFRVVIETVDKIGWETVNEHLLAPEEISDLSVAYTILHRFYETRKFDSKHNPDDSINKIQSVLCQTNRAPRTPRSSSAKRSQGKHEFELDGKGSLRKSALKRGYEEMGVHSASKLSIKKGKLNDKSAFRGEDDEPKRSKVKFSTPHQDELKQGTEEKQKSENRRIVRKLLTDEKKKMEIEGESASKGKVTPDDMKAFLMLMKEKNLEKILLSGSKQTV